MKKIASFFATIAAVAALSACSQDDTPVLHTPTEFKLNTPPFAEQLYQLTDNGQLTFSCSQPDYGLGVETTYSLEISLTDDFLDSRTVTLTNPLSATMTTSTAGVNLAILDMLGVIDEETWAPYADNRVMPLYVRATAQTAQVEYSKITSNVVKLPNVEIYFAIKVPGYIFLTGYPEFTEPNEANKDKLIRLYESEDAIDSKIYSAVIEDVPAGSVAFRFFTTLTGWDGNSLGAGEADMTDIDISKDFVNGEYNGDIVVGGKSNWKIDWAGGDLTITVDLNDNKITIQAGAVEIKPTTYIYMVGNNADWKAPCVDNQEVYDNWRISCSDGSGIYSATFDLAALPADDLYCRFFANLGTDEWNGVKAKWASDPDGSVNVEVTSGTEYPTVEGDGCFMMKGAKGKTVNVVLDTNANKVKFTFVE